jgi:ostA family protein
MFITKKALIASLVDKDSVYIHAKRIMVTGKTGARIVRAYTGARIYKTDIQGKCDSIHSSQTTGLTQLIGKPILWSGKSQMTGDHIQLLANTQTEKLDSLRVFDNAFLIEKDTLGEGYNQVKGKTLKGKFKENKLNNVNLYQNTEVIYYVYDDQNNPAGINKSKCSQIRVDFATNQQIETVIFYKDVDGGIYPEDKINKEELRFPNFNWRGDEIILSKNDIFPEEEKNIQLTPIKGIKTEEIDLIEEKLNPKIEN